MHNRGYFMNTQTTSLMNWMVNTGTGHSDWLVGWYVDVTADFVQLSSACSVADEVLPTGSNLYRQQQQLRKPCVQRLRCRAALCAYSENVACRN